MSGGSKKIPKAPDVGRNVNQANEQFDTATSQAGQLWNTAQGYNQSAQDFNNRIVGQTTPTMDAINSNATQNLQSYGQNFIPLQQQQVQDAQRMASPDYQATQRAHAMADVGAANAAARRNSQRALTSAGVDPSSVQGAALDRQANVVGAAAAAAAGQHAQETAQMQGQQAVAAANQLGLGVGQAGVQSGATGAQIGQSLLQGTNATNAGSVNNSLAPATYMGVAQNANNSAANILSQNYQDQLARTQAQAGGSQDMMGNIGAGVGAIAQMWGGKGGGTSALAEGGPVPSEGALPESPIPGSTDTKPAFLTPGEWVIPKDVVEWKGHEFFHKMIDKERLNMNERKTVPMQVLAHKTDNSSTGRMEGGVIPDGYSKGGPVPASDHSSSLSHAMSGGNHESIGTRFGLKFDPLAYIFGKKYKDFINKTGDTANEFLSEKVMKPVNKFDRKINPIHRAIDRTSIGGKVHEWTDNKPGSTLGLVAGGYAAGSALAGGGGAAAGGGGGGAAAGGGLGAGGGGLGVFANGGAGGLAGVGGGNAGALGASGGISGGAGIGSSTEAGAAGAAGWQDWAKMASQAMNKQGQQQQAPQIQRSGAIPLNAVPGGFQAPQQVAA